MLALPLHSGASAQHSPWTAADRWWAARRGEDASWSREVGERAGAGGRSTQRREAFWSGQGDRPARGRGRRQQPAGDFFFFFLGKQVISYFLNCKIEFEYDE